MVGEELGVLPGMDSIFSALALERFVGFLREMPQKNHQKDKFDIIIYDGISTEETIRMMGATSKVRLVTYVCNLSLSVLRVYVVCVTSFMKLYATQQIILEVYAKPC